MSPPSKAIAAWLKRKINVAKAKAGLSWPRISEALAEQGTVISAGSLMSKHSRGSFTAGELLALLQVLGVRTLNIPTHRDPEHEKTADPS